MADECGDVVRLGGGAGGAGVEQHVRHAGGLVVDDLAHRTALIGSAAGISEVGHVRRQVTGGLGARDATPDLVHRVGHDAHRDARAVRAEGPSLRAALRRVSL